MDDEVTLDECDALIAAVWQAFKINKDLATYESLNEWLDYRYVLQMRELATAKAA